MKKFKTTSNQWTLSIGLSKKSYGASRWLLWITYGFTSISWTWGDEE
jgi:hypothetical protein